MIDNDSIAKQAEMFPDALQDISQRDPESHISKAEKLREKWCVELGQVWQAQSKKSNGVHRIVCGDCTSSYTVHSVMNDDIAEIIFTSPPYLDLRTYGRDTSYLENILGFIPVCFKYARYQCVNLGIVQRDGAVVCYWDTYIEVAQNNGYKLLSWNVWDKLQANSVGSQNRMFALEHEWIFVFGKKPKNLIRTIENKESSKKRYYSNPIDEHGRFIKQRREPDGTMRFSTIGTRYEKKNMGTVLRQYAEMARNITDKHPAVMRVDVLIAYINAMVNQCDLVLDPFLGSGTTIAACEITGRLGRGIEISPAYVAVTLQRLADMGLKPERVK